MRANAPAGGRVFDVTQTVPDQNAGIKLVVDDAGAACLVSPDAGVSPCAAKRAGNAFPVQVNGNGLWAFAGSKLSEDAANDGCFLRHNLPVAPDRLAVGVEFLHHLVTVAKPAARLALLHPAPKAAMRLHGKVFQEQDILRAFQADMKLGDFPSAKVTMVTPANFKCL